MFSKPTIFGGALLVAGTAIGAGMLALPVVTSLGGFLPACAIYFLCWIFMTSTGLLLLEVCLSMPQHSNIISMATHYLGKKGKWLSWILYIFLFYFLTIAYVAGGGGLVRALFGGDISPFIAIPLFTLIFSPVVYIGTHAVDRSNFLLMIGLIVTYFLFVFIGWKHIDTELLKTSDWSAAILGLPVIFTSFSYQGIIPSLTDYFKRHAQFVRKAVIIGSSIPFVVYVIWEFLILGIIPVEGPNGLLAAKIAGNNAVDPLKHFVESPYTYVIGQAFAFFALTTSFLGVTLGLLDFLADGLKMKKVGWNKGLLFTLVFVPPTLIAMFNPGIFIRALSYAGGIGCALLLGLLPILMVWVGRYRKKWSVPSQLMGGKPFLVILALFVVFELCIELFNELKL